MTLLQVDSHMTRHDKMFVCVYDMLEFTESQSPTENNKNSVVWIERK